MEEYHRHCLEEELPMLLEDAPLQLKCRMYFVHDGTPAHFSLIVGQHLEAVYQNRWIGRGGIQPWPPRSPVFSLGPPQIPGLYHSF